MRILIVGLVKNAQLKRVQNEGEKRGHQVDGCYVSELTIHAEEGIFEPKLRNKHFKDYDLIYFWALGVRRWEWYLAAEFLNKKEKTIIVNKNTIDPSFNYSTTPVRSFLLQVENKLPFPKSTLIFCRIWLSIRLRAKAISRWAYRLKTSVAASWSPSLPGYY